VFRADNRVTLYDLQIPDQAVQIIQVAQIAEVLPEDHILRKNLVHAQVPEVGRYPDRVVPDRIIKAEILPQDQGMLDQVSQVRVRV
jgi:hypothetical protein